MKVYELLEKQASMMRMAEKYGIDDWRELVKIRRALGEYVPFNSYTSIDCLSIHHDYKFALGVVEGKAVFEGDELWFNSGDDTWKKIIIEEYHCIDDTRWSWNPPKPKTVTIGNVECALPDSKNHLEPYAILQIGDTQFYYTSEAERDNTEIAIVQLLRGE